MWIRMLVLVLGSSVTLRMTDGLLFRPDQFKDMTENCRKSNGKPIRFILNEDNPAMYVSVDPAHPTLMALQRAERVKLFNKFTLDDKGRLLLQVFDSWVKFVEHSVGDLATHYVNYGQLEVEFLSCQHNCQYARVCVVCGLYTFKGT